MRTQRVRKLLGHILAVLMALAPAAAEEGKWTPQQVLDLDAEQLKAQGLQLPVARLWDPQKGTGLLAGAVALPGCSAAFVSSRGLILTNHHCLFSLIQEHSTPQRDLISSGFVAHSQSEELPGKTMRVLVPRKFTDVTRTMQSAVPAGADDMARAKAIEGRQKALVTECEKTPLARCSVASFDSGLAYVLVENRELTDIRLVYAPPRAVGEFGGEIDNYRWPRHVGDFAMARAYQDGKPYQPQFYFPISPAGVKPGDFVMVMGYPGRTYRSLTGEEMANERDLRYALDREVFGEWIRILEGIKSPEGSIAVAATLKALNNAHTRAQGQLDGLARGHLVEKQKANDDAVAAWAAARPEFAGAVSAKKELDRLAQEVRQSGVHDYLLSVIAAGPLALKHAVFLVHFAAERQKPDAARDPGYQQRDLPRLRAALERDQKSYFRAADEALFASWVNRALALHGGRIRAVDGAFTGPDPAGAVRRMYDSTRVTDLAERLKMFEETPQELKARKDPLIDFAIALDSEVRAWRIAAEKRQGAITRLRPQWRRAVLAQAGKPSAPDANGTLRVSFAHVMGYSPRDGVLFTPQTTLSGMIEKYTGEDPFVLPPLVLNAAKTGNAGRTPVDFLADADTTGGNSGSPVVNGRGELVGVNFDRVWENVANDFGYDPSVNRNISVDVRFLIWMLADVQHASEILDELGIRR